MKINNRLGGVDRAKKAREDMLLTLNDESCKEYFDKDIDFARKHKVSRHTIYKIREQYNIPSRSERILSVLKTIDFKKITIKELSKKLNLKYQNIYKIAKDNNIYLKLEKQP